VTPGGLGPAGRRRPGGAGPFTYRLFFLDRAQGAIVEELDLGPLNKPLDASQSTITRDHLLLTTAERTLIISTRPSGGAL